MLTRSLPPRPEMLEAFQRRDASYEGIFFTAVKTTGIFCRPSCPARRPAPENVEFFASARDALAHGYRPCKRCHPLEMRGETPDEIRELLDELRADPATRILDRHLRERGMNPAFVRRWFKKHHGMTFHAYQRARRLAAALHQLSNGSNVAATAFEHGFESVSGFHEAIRQVTGRSPARSRDAEVVYLSRILTPLGPMLAGATAAGLCLLEFTDRRMLATQLKRLEDRLDCTFLPGTNAVLQQAEKELSDYFEGRLTRFDTPLLLRGTEFQERVWLGLQRIPFGEVRSYAQQARDIGAPEAVRAVARANGENRIAIIIPCHRVIGADGSLTGYGGGLWRKRYLLELEGSKPRDLFSLPTGPA